MSRLTDEQLQVMASHSDGEHEYPIESMAAELTEARREIGELKDAIEFTVALRRDSVARLCDESAQKASALMKIAALEAERDRCKTALIKEGREHMELAVLHNTATDIIQDLTKERDELRKFKQHAQEVARFTLDAYEHRKNYLYDEVADKLRELAGKG